MSRLKELRKSRGLTQQSVADALGLHITNYNRLENGKTKLDQERIVALARILKCDPLELVSNTPGVRIVKVRQHVQAGSWSESSLWPEDDWYDVAVPDDPTWRPIELHAAETRGPSMNRRYPEGSALIFASMYDTEESLQPGRRYIVEHERPDGLYESTVKTLWKDDAGEFWLLPESDDPRFQAPLPLHGVDGSTIRIVGRVLYSVQREP